MKYVNKSFQIAVGSPKTSQEEWDRIFGKKKSSGAVVGTQAPTKRKAKAGPNPARRNYA